MNIEHDAGDGEVTLMMTVALVGREDHFSNLFNEVQKKTDLR